MVINELYYDHPGSDQGWEFVELLATGDLVCDLSGAYLEFIDGRTGGTRTVWYARDGLEIVPGGYLLIAGSGRNPSPGLLLTGTLENGPDAIRLSIDGRIVDLVGYGDLGLQGPFEGEPAADVEAGSSLARRPDGHDTGCNGTDLVPADPTPGVRNFHSNDLRLAFSNEPEPPCRGGSSTQVLCIEDIGLYRFTSMVEVEIAVYVRGATYAYDRIRQRCVLSGARTDSFAITVSIPPSELVAFESIIESESDGNPANDTARATQHTSPGTIVINEIMYRPLDGGSEWIELLNRGNRPCCINGWSMRDRTGMWRLISDHDLWIEPGGYLILAQYPDRVIREGIGGTVPVYGVSGGWPVLNDRSTGEEADRIELADESGWLAERVGYGDVIGDERGRSIERFSGHACSSYPGGLWHRCGHAYGSTPGRENSVGGEVGFDASTLVISPNPFCMQRDRTVEIAGACRGGENGFLVRVFDMEGYEVRRLYGEEGGARPFSCCWDGRDGRGVPVRTGLYIVVVEFLGMGGGVCRKETGCLAVYDGYGGP
ncbi:MAG: lamin tail domain-containing protein [bacterium]|nr:MAG: lamin tail domain-containing protein [bacterium]